MISFVRSLTVALLSGVVALLFATAGNGSRRVEPTFSSGDLRVVVATKPTQPKQLRFTVGDPYLGTGGTFSAGNYLSYTHDKAFVARLKQDGFILGGHTRWDPNGRFGDLYAAVVFGFLFKRSSGAHAWYAAMRGKLSLSKTTEVPHAELGGESTGRYGRDNEEAAFFLWRRGNLVLFSGMNCEGPCGFDLAKASRVYADAIDATARRVS